MKYRWIVRFAMHLHAIHIQALQDKKKQWISTQNKLRDEERKIIIDDFPAEWKIPVSSKESSDIETHPPPDALVDHT